MRQIYRQIFASIERMGIKGSSVPCRCRLAFQSFDRCISYWKFSWKKEQISTRPEMVAYAASCYSTWLHFTCKLTIKNLWRNFRSAKLRFEIGLSKAPKKTKKETWQLRLIWSSTSICWNSSNSTAKNSTNTQISSQSGREDFYTSEIYQWKLRFNRIEPEDLKRISSMLRVRSISRKM